MNRRCFINNAALTGAGILMTAKTFGDTKNITKKTCKITVVKTMLNKEIEDLIEDRPMEVCPIFNQGQEFVFESPYEIPEGFCQWAWADIRPYILSFFFDREHPVIACCTDGIRPVVFKLEQYIYDK